MANISSAQVPDGVKKGLPAGMAEPRMVCPNKRRNDDRLFVLSIFTLSPRRDPAPVGEPVVWLYVFGLLALPASLVLYLLYPDLTAARWSVALAIFALPFWLLSGRRNQANPPIVFFDGVCGLCNSSVDFIQAEDHRRVFKFAPLQGDTARRMLATDKLADLKSMVYVDEHGQYERSSAILRIGTRLGNIWSVAWLGFLIPERLRNALYDFIARNRYRWFGQKEACRIPTAEERAYFLP